LEQESEILSNLKDIEQNGEKYFGDVNELRGGEYKDILQQKVNFKWNNQFRNYDYYKKVQGDVTEDKNDESEDPLLNEM